MILFVGDKPSKKNLDPNIAFVGTNSHKTLMSWIGKSGLSDLDIIFTNQDKLTIFHDILFYNDNMIAHIDDLNIVALGVASKNKLTSFGLEFFSMPHPSGLNRQLNDKNYINQKLKEMSAWLKNRIL